ncbi:MAG: hypothetical protein OEL52_05340 [Nitrosopumilus sp.]|nr:hypothetical protein [Nitrosopumilus sp.]MDH3853718.1 hypothetical protein [Nitrosopumilus sp.]
MSTIVIVPLRVLAVTIAGASREGDIGVCIGNAPIMTAAPSGEPRRLGNGSPPGISPVRPPVGT